MLRQPAEVLLQRTIRLRRIIRVGLQPFRPVMLHQRVGVQQQLIRLTIILAVLRRRARLLRLIRLRRTTQVGLQRTTRVMQHRRVEVLQLHIQPIITRVA